MMISEADFKKIIIGIIIIGLIVAAFIIITPIISAIAWGLILAYIFHPVYNFVLKRVKEKNISALIIVLLIIFILFIPLWFLFPIVSKQIFDVYSYFQTLDIASLLEKLLPSIFSSPSLQTETLAMINNFVSKLIASIASSLSNILVNLPRTLLGAVVVLFTFYFSLRDSNKLTHYILEISPFSKSLQRNLSNEFKNLTNSIIYGHIIVGIVQGLFTGLGLWIAGVPQPLLLTLVAVFAAIIPVLGAWLVWVPAAIYLLTTGHVGVGIGLIIYGAVFISWIDNVLRIWIVARKSKVSSGIIFIGMIGGLIVFGVIGLILGPLILSYLLILLDAYKEKKFSELFS